ncbi:cell envelope biogenesis protein TolA [Nocardiopsis sp. CT-R113]|uniref:Cell envelope biogenesis protein TolA n=1 Tax=Nocardiopsis codii TaxID=3065942 RepID=A0ABU7K603_9ACTN|nr:cell envelope biogenesis protein TolA [Nocardiopsis sp. CT-R113]MEE2037680.1 cell envelope biogenesis protein TolA [Nocardiopsis sp. CT-R113]
MKFELVEPSEEDSTNRELPAPGARSEGAQEPSAPPLGHEHADALVRPVRERMNTAVEGVRASLNQLRAHVADENTAEALRSVASVPEIGAGTVFHAHRFAAPTQAGER